MRMKRLRTNLIRESREERNKRIVALYLSGKSCAEISREVGLAVLSVWKILKKQPGWKLIKKAGWKARKRRRQESIAPYIKKVVDLYRSGMTANQISRELHFSRARIREILKRGRARASIKKTASKARQIYPRELERKFATTIVDLYRKGLSIPEVADRIGLRKGTVARILSAQKDWEKVKYAHLLALKKSAEARLESARDHLPKIRDLYVRGDTLENIGRRFGVSRQRIFQILSAMPDWQQIRQARGMMRDKFRAEVEKILQSKSAEIINRYAHGGSFAEILTDLGLDRKGQSGILDELPEWVYLRIAAWEARKALRERRKRGSAFRE